MKKIITLVCAACTLVLANVGSSIADSSNFAGPYIGISGLSAGIEAKGDARDGDGASNDRVQFGKTTFGAGIEGGYAVPIGSMFLLDVGAAYFTGEAELEYHEDKNPGASDKDVRFKVGEGI